MNIRQSAYTSLFILFATACSGAETPEPASPAAATAEEPDAVEEESFEAPEEEEAVDEGPTGPTGGRSPKDMITTESTRFTLSFSSSDPGMKAEERCDSKHSGDPRKRNQCMKTARSTVKEDVMEFKEEQGGRWVWIVSNQRGSSLRRLKRLNFTWGEETKNSIEIQPSKGAKIVIGVPNNYSIVIQDPKHGKLTYDAKITD